MGSVNIMTIDGLEEFTMGDLGASTGMTTVIPGGGTTGAVAVPVGTQPQSQQYSNNAQAWVAANRPYLIASSVIGTAAGIAGAYHGYKRNQSVGWAIGWAILSSMFWPIAVPVMFAQGFGKRAEGLSGLGAVTRRKKGAKVSLLSEAKRAYSDDQGIRNLDWRANRWVSLDEWGKIMTAAAPEYNYFDAREVWAILSRVPGISGAKFLPAREGSVAVYIKGTPEVLKKIKHLKGLGADEAWLTNSSGLRLWWD